MKMKLTKIVYDHTDEGIKAVNYYSPCADDDPEHAFILDGDISDTVNARLEFMYTPSEWEDALYWIRSNGLAIDVVKAIDEVSYG